VNPLVSVIVAVHNGERFLAEALDSLFAQDYEPFEAIVVDDGSTDATPEIAARYPVAYVHQENQGVSAARNTGLAHARGELVAFLDHDDRWPAGKLTSQVARLVERPEVGCVLGRQELVFAPGTEPPEWLARDPVYGDLDGIPFVSAVVRRDALERVGGFDPAFTLAEDRDLMVRLRAAGVVIDVIEDVVLQRRFHGDNRTYGSTGHNHPLLRSLKAKIDRERAAGGSHDG
jgi:glycosyltransferase involved in cell wall biosynthesis